MDEREKKGGGAVEGYVIEDFYLIHYSVSIRTKSKVLSERFNFYPDNNARGSGGVGVVRAIMI